VIAGLDLFHVLCPGTRVLTADGEQAVETLNPGDRVITRDRGIAALRNICIMPLPVDAQFVTFPQNALGQGCPQRTLNILPTQPIALRGVRANMLYSAPEARVAAGRLVDGRVVTVEKISDGIGYALVFDAPLAIYAEGLELISAADLSDPCG
jgi:hypothetical protein